MNADRTNKTVLGLTASQRARDAGGYTGRIMKAMRGAVIVAVAAAIVQAHPRDVKSTYDLIKKGAALSATDAARLEERLKKKAGDEEARIQLLSYYAGPPADADLSKVKAARAAHIDWLIANDPKAGLGLFQIATGIYRLHCRGDELADPDAFARASQRWLEQVRKNPGNAEIRRKAVDAIGFCSPEQAERLLSAANDTPGLGRLYASAVLGTTGDSYRNNDPAGSDAEFRARPFAEKARRELAGATDKDLIVAAARALLLEGAILWADGKLDWDYTPTGNALLAKAKELAPDEMTLMTLPTALPARGERPAATLTIGGNVQSAQLVRQVQPVYPSAARAQDTTSAATAGCRSCCARSQAPSR